jgi:hypothetical protein
MPKFNVTTTAINNRWPQNAAVCHNGVGEVRCSQLRAVCSEANGEQGKRTGTEGASSNSAHRHLNTQQTFSPVGHPHPSGCHCAL